MSEIVSHTGLTAHSPPFSLVGGTTYQILLTGTIADGSDSPELQRLVNGSFVSLDPPVRYKNGDAGGTRQTKVLPTGQQFHWTVPGSKLSVNTRIVGGG
jgi:hypothetical protein